MYSSTENRSYEIAQFASKMGLSTDLREPQRHIPGSATSFYTPSHEQNAQNMLADAKAAKLEALSWFRRKFISKKKQMTFSNEEISAQLLNATVGQSPGLVEVLRNLLLQSGGDINHANRESKPFWKRIWTSNETNERSNLLAIAVTNSNLDLVQLLVSNSDQASLDEALAITLQSNTENLLILEVLLANGADAKYHDEAFQAAVLSHNTLKIELLINACSPISKESVSEGLLPAVRLGFLDSLFLLVLGGAHGGGPDGNGHALKEAVRAGRLDFVTAITLCDPLPSARILDEAVGMISSMNEDHALLQKSLVKHLLIHGARGTYSDSFLISITTRCMSERSKSTFNTLKSIMELLVNHESSINYEAASALKLCVAKTRIDLIDILLHAKVLDKDLASEAFAMIDPKATPEQRLKIASDLLARGAHGTPLHEALIHAVAMNHIEAIELLLSRKFPGIASVDYCDAQGLKDAASREELEIVDILLAANPSKASLKSAFPHIKTNNKETRLYLTQAFLDKGLEGSKIHGALGAAISDYSSTRDDRLVRLLVQKGVSVDSHIDSAVAREDELLLAMLLNGNPSKHATSSSLATALKVQELTVRLHMIQLLLGAGANVNHEDEMAILAATQAGDLMSLETLLHCLPQPKSLEAAFGVASAMEDAQMRYILCEKLLNSGAQGEVVNKALIAGILQEQQSTVFLKLLSPYASVDFDNGRALCLAIDNMLHEHLLILLTMKPSIPTFDKALTAVMTLDDEHIQFKFLKSILEAGPEIGLLSKALVISIENHKRHASYLLLRHGASVDFNEGAPLVAAVSARNASLLKLFVDGLSQKPSSASLAAGLNAAIMTESDSAKQKILQILLSARVPSESLNSALFKLTRDEQPDYPTIDTLLKYGASVHYKNNMSLLQAAKSSKLELLRALLRYVKDSSAVSVVFTDRLKDESFWKDPAGVDIMSMILRKGVSQDLINQALVDAITRYQSQPGARKFVILLLENRADINSENCMALKAAVNTGDVELLQVFLDRDCSQLSLSLTFPYILQSGLQVSVAATLVSKFALHKNQRFGDAFVHPEFPESPIILSMWNYPQSVDVLASVLDAGFPVDQIGQGKIGTTPLFWAMYCPNKAIDNSIIEHLIQRGANLHGYPESLMHVAIREQRLHLIHILLQAKIDLDTKDNKGRTPLAYATEIGDTVSMEALLKAGADVDDDALHVAARSLNTEAIRLLIINGHDVNRPSIKHQGRTPLAELCHTALPNTGKSSGNTMEKLLRKTFQTLIDNGSRTDIRIPNDQGGKSLLLHALDSTSPCLMARTFLACGQFHLINEDFNLFFDGEYYYSPTKYIEKGHCKSEKSYHAELIELLKIYHAKPRYWKACEQPEDMVDPPEFILRAEQDRMIMEESIRRLKKENELEQALLASRWAKEVELESSKLDWENKISDDRHQRELRQQTDVHKMKYAFAEQDANHRLNYSRSMNKEALNFTLVKNRQNLEYEDASLTRRQRGQKMEIYKQENLVRLKDKSVGIDKDLMNKQIEFGSLLMKAKLEMDNMNWIQNDPKSALAPRKAISSGKIRNRITEV